MLTLIRQAGVVLGPCAVAFTGTLDFSADSPLRARVDASLGGASGSFAGQEMTMMKAKITPFAVNGLNVQRVGFIGAATCDLLTKSSLKGTVPKDDGNSATDDLQGVAADFQGAVSALEAAGVNKIVTVDQLDTLQHNKELAALIATTGMVYACLADSGGLRRQWRSDRR